MADEGIGYIISVEVDAAAVGPELNKLQPLVEQAVTAANRELSQLGNVDVFRQISQGASVSTASLRELSAAARASVEVFKLLEQAQAAGGPGATASIGGQSIADVRAQHLALSAERDRRASGLTQAGAAAFSLVDAGAVKSAEELDAALSHLGFSAKATRTALAELTESGYAPLARLTSELDRNNAAYQAGNEARIAGASAGQEGWERDIGLLGQVGALIAENTGRTDAQTVASLRQLGVAEAIASAEEAAAKAKKEVSDAQLITLARQQLGADLATTKADAKDATLAPVSQRNAEIEAQLVGLGEKQRINQLGLIIAEERYNALLRNELATTVEIASARRAIETANARIAADQAKTAATSAASSGGGGFFGGITRGLGQSGGGGSNSEDLGFQLGSVAKYLVYYQVFRDIEHAIGDAVKETIEFERGVTNLSLQLGIGRENARGLATELGNIAAAGGLNPSQGAALGGQFAGSFSSTEPNADPAALARQGATLAAQLSLVSGPKDVAKELLDASAATQAFNLSSADTPRVLDAATNAATKFIGAVDPAKVLPGLAEIADLANSAGLSLEQTANLLGKVTQRTGEDSTAAAGELRRILGTEGKPAFQQVFTQENIDTTQSFAQEVEQLSVKFNTLDASGQRAILSVFGGSGKSAAAAQVFLESFATSQDDANASLAKGGSTAAAAGARLDDLKGILTVLRGEVANLAKDFGESGLFDGFGVILKSTEALVGSLDRVIQTLNFLPKGFRDSVIGAGELLVVVRALGAAGVLSGLNGRIDQATRALVGGRTLPGGARTTTAVDSVAPEVVAAGQRVATELTTAGGLVVDALTATAERIATAGVATATAQESVAAEQALALGFSRTANGQLRNEETGRFASASDNRLALASQQGFSNEATIGTGRISDETLAAGGLQRAGAAGGAGALAAVGGAAGVVNIALAAVVSGVLVDQVVQKVKTQQDAIGAAAATGLTGGSSAADLQSQASAAANAAVAARQSGSGFIGTITSGLTSVFHDVLGGVGLSTGDAADIAKQNAALALTEANRLTAASSANPASGSAFDFSAPGGIALGFTNLAKTGASASQVLDALNARLEAFVAASRGVAGTLVPGAAPVFAAGIANTAGNQLKGNADIVADSLRGNPGRIVDALKGTTPDDIETRAYITLANQLVPYQDALDKAGANFLKSQNLNGGGTPNAQQKAGLLQALTVASNEALKQAGLTPEEIQALSSDTQDAIKAAIAAQFAALSGSKGIKLTPEQVGAIVQGAGPLITQAGTAATATATLNGDPRGAGVAGTQAALTEAKRLLTNTRAASDGSAASNLLLQNLKTDVDLAQIAATTQTVAHLQALGALVQAQQANNPAAAIATKINTLKAEIAVTTGADDLTKLATEMAQAMAQAAQIAETDAEALINATIVVGNALSSAEAAYRIALLQLGQLQGQLSLTTAVTQGLPESPAVIAARNNATAAGDAFFNQQQADANAAKLAKVDPRDTQKLDRTTVSNLQDTLKTLKDTGQQGSDTFTQTQRELTAAKQKVVDDGVAFAQSQAAADAGLGKVSEASAGVKEAKIKLDSDIKGTTQYNNDLAAYKRAQTQMASAANTAAKDDPFNANLEAGIDPRDTLALAAAKLTEDAHAASSATTEKARAEGRLGLVKDQLALEQTQAAQDEAKRSAQARVGDPVSQAIAGLANARQQLSLDLKGTQQFWQDYAALQNAKQSLAQAELDAAKNSDALKGDPTDPVKQATDAVIEARRQLASDRKHKTGDVAADQASVETAELAKQKAVFDQQLSNQTTAYNLHEESAQEYTKFLTAQDAALRKTLAGMHKGQAGYQQAVDELNTIDQAIQGLNDSLGGQFNLGDIKLPTVYEVRRQVAANSAGTAIDASAVHNVEVTINGADFQAVVNYLNQVLGVRGGTTVATTGRKAA